MTNKTLISAGHEILLDLLPQCTEAAQYMFKRMYCHTNLNATIEEAVLNMNPKHINIAIHQAEATIKGYKEKDLRNQQENINLWNQLTLNLKTLLNTP